MSKKFHLIAQRIVALGLMALILLSMYGAHQSQVWAAIGAGQRIPLLLFGVDAADASQHTDTLILTVFDPIKDGMNLVSIPRDTRVKIKGYRFRRINEIYGYHFRKKKDPRFAAQKVVDGIEGVISAEDRQLNIPYFLQVDYSGFGRLVSLIGGVWVVIKQPMHYDDFAGNYHFHKEPGRYLLRGREALNYVRFRGKTGDRGRILRQQAFLRSMAKRMANPLTIFKIPQFINIIVSSINTNLSFWDMVYLVTECRHVRSKSLGFYILPGVPKGPYWKIKKKAAHRLASMVLEGRDGTVEQVVPIVPHQKGITVKVWNASGQRGLARRVTKYLRKAGHDVVDWGNYTINQVPTRVVDRTGHLANAKEIAETLGIETTHSELNVQSLVDVEVVLGKNYRGPGVR